MFEGEEHTTSEVLQRREPVALGERSDLGEKRTGSVGVISSNEFSLPWFFRLFFIKEKGTKE